MNYVGIFLKKTKDAQSVTVRICNTCGAMILDTKLHKDWHSKVGQEVTFRDE